MDGVVFINSSYRKDKSFQVYGHFLNECGTKNLRHFKSAKSAVKYAVKMAMDFISDGKHVINIEKDIVEKLMPEILKYEGQKLNLRFNFYGY